MCYSQGQNQNAKDEAKARTPEAEAMAWTLEAMAKTKDTNLCPWGFSRPRPVLEDYTAMQCTLLAYCVRGHKMLLYVCMCVYMYVEIIENLSQQLFFGVRARPSFVPGGGGAVKHNHFLRPLALWQLKSKSTNSNNDLPLNFWSSLISFDDGEDDADYDQGW